jgi:hypothetical protein
MTDTTPTTDTDAVDEPAWKRRYLESEVETGRRVMTCPVTDDVYVVTRWVKRGDHSRALDKERADASEEDDPARPRRTA